MAVQAEVRYAKVKTARYASLEEIATLLKEQHAAKVDMVVPFNAVSSHDGVIRVKTMPEFEDYTELVPTEIADGHLAERLGIPTAYHRTMRAQRPDLYDANVNGWLHGDPTDGYADETYPSDNRSVLLRTFQGELGTSEPGVLRAVLSDRYGIIDNLDVLMAALAGIQATGTPIEVLGADLTESRMTIRIAAPEIMVNANELMKDYRSPFGEGGVYWHEDGKSGHYGPGQLPKALQDKYGVDPNGVCAGLFLGNSETGGGAFQLGPRFTFLACANGAQITRDVMRQVHLGGKLQEGTVDWSEETRAKALDLITSQAKDAVQAFLNPEYIAKEIAAMTAKAGVEVSDPVKTIEFVSKQLAFTEDQQAGILDHFIKGGQVTAGGVMQAVTSFCQTVADPDVAFDMESLGLKALDLAAKPLAGAVSA